MVQVRGLDPPSCSARVAVHRLGTWAAATSPGRCPSIPRASPGSQPAPGALPGGLINLMQPKPVPVVVRFPRRRPLTLTVPPARPLAGRMVDGAGHGVAGVQVVAGGSPAACPRTRGAAAWRRRRHRRHRPLRAAPRGPGPSGRSPAGRPSAPRVPAPSAGRNATWCCASAAAAPSPGGLRPRRQPPGRRPGHGDPVVHGRHAVRAVRATPGAPGWTRRRAPPAPTWPPRRSTVVKQQGARRASQTLLVTAGAKRLTASSSTPVTRSHKPVVARVRVAANSTPQCDASAPGLDGPGMWSELQRAKILSPACQPQSPGRFHGTRPAVSPSSPSSPPSPPARRPPPTPPGPPGASSTPGATRSPAPRWSSTTIPPGASPR